MGTTTSEAKAAQLRKQGFEVAVLDLNKDLAQDLNVFFRDSEICILNFPPQRNADAQGREKETESYGQLALKAAALFPGTTRFIFVSSTGVYPDHITLAREADFDRTFYTGNNSMAYAEEALHRKLGKQLTVVRMAGLIGGGRHIGKYFEGKKNIPGGDAPVNLIHQTDCVRIIERIIERNAWGETFNACASQHPSRRDYYTFCCEQYGLEKPDFPQETDPTPGKQIDNEKSKEILGFEYVFDDPYGMV